MIDLLLDISTWSFQTPNFLSQSLTQSLSQSHGNAAQEVRTFHGIALIVMHGDREIIFRIPSLNTAHMKGLERWYYSNVSIGILAGSRPQI